MVRLVQKILYVLLVYFILLATTLPLFAACGGSSPNLIAATANRSDVSDCIDTATYGDIISIPPCASGSCIWTTGLTITKNIRIIGAGIDQTYLTLNFTNNGTYEAFFQFTPDSTAAANIDSLLDSGIFEVSGITFVGSSMMSNKFAVLITNNIATALRRIAIHSNKYTSLYRAVTLQSGPIYGVFFNNILVDSSASYNLSSNNTAWDDFPMTLGSGDGWYLEDNILSFDLEVGYVAAGGHGMGRVVRYNTITSGEPDFYVEWHGNQQASIASTQIQEIYGNLFPYTTQQNGMTPRGGRSIVFYNNLYDTGITISEEYNDDASGSYPFLTGACAMGDPQVCAEDCVCMKPNHSYFWNNRRSTNNSIISARVIMDSVESGGDISDPLEVVENREFWTQRLVAFDGSVSAIGSCGYYGDNSCTKSGVGCGTLASRPITCTTGVAYWATDQSCSDLTDYIGVNPTEPISGVLYKCTNTDTWTEYYVPYNYPHPLRDGIENPTIVITSPTSASTYNTSSASLPLSGTASVDTTSVTWTCSNCTVASGTATGTTAWTQALTLTSGVNTIVVTAHDAAANTGTDQLVVTYTPTSESGTGSSLRLRK